MCAKYARIHDINNYRKMQAFKWVYEAEVGELGPEGMYSAVLMSVLKVTSNSSIVSDWEARPNGGMADEWESNDEGEEEGVSAADLQVGHDFYTQVVSRVVAGARLVGDCDDLHVAAGSLCQADPPQCVADPSSSGIVDQSACNCMITRHTWSSDPKEESCQGFVRYDWLGKPEHSGQNGKPAWRNVARSKESLMLSREVVDEDVGMFQEYFEENSRWKYRNFSSDTCEGIVRGVPSNWTEAHTCSLYDSIVADPIQCTKNVWTPAHICWMMKSIWFCDKITQLSQVTGVDASILRCQWTAVFRRIHPFIQRFCHTSIRENAIRSPSFWPDLSNLVGEYWLATSDPVSSDMDTGPSDMEGDGDKDAGYGAAQPPATPMDVDLPAPEGKPNGNKTGEEWQDEGEVEEGNEGEVEEEDDEEVKKVMKPKRKSPADRKEEEKDHEADNEREEEEEVDELEGRGASNIAPALKKKGYTCTSWLVDLNQHLRQGKTQPAMCAYMVEMEEEDVLEILTMATPPVLNALSAVMVAPTVSPVLPLQRKKQPAWTRARARQA
ncbi:hypothetical protein ARMGADRAFT_1035828 [Armillaria gallica]|uniref:Uncharacterized protein n=1 Tax=Armillaria gallica TaxID=47427 RepID=A0A2H3D5N4_ARMGA|nr:hypothetical protein ARMGADRAFT_1035828 [Armillaria gallica]